MGAASGRNARAECRPHRCLPTIAELGPAACEGRLAGVGPRYAGRSWLGARATATSSCGLASASSCGCASGSASASGIRSASGSRSGSISGRARADMGCAPARGAELPHCARRPHVGRRTDRAPSRAQRSVVGPHRRRRAARAYVGLACAGAIAIRPATCPFMGRQQTVRPGRVHAGPVMGLARQRVEASRVGLGRARAGVVGCPRGFRTERAPGRGAVMERAGRAGMGCSQDSGARRSGRAIVVGPIGCAGAADGTAATGCTAAASAAACAAAASRPCSSVVAARRVCCPAEVPRASDGGLAAGPGSSPGPSPVAVARGGGPTRNACAAGPAGA